jgi:dihydroorotase
MSILIKNANVYYQNKLVKMDLYINNEGKIIIDKNIKEVAEIIDAKGKFVFPGFVDIHTHFREPGFEYKETIRTGSKAALKGGVTTAFMMPNLNPCIDNINEYQKQLERINNTKMINLYQIAAITEKQEGNKLSNINQLSKLCKWFSDDGKGIQSEALMRKAMLLVKKNNGIITAHCEDESELDKNSSINLGIKSKEYNLVGINNASEYNEVKRDLRLAEETGCKFHICHISAKESVKALENARLINKNLSGEVTVHHLLLNENDIKQNNGKYKMNPPLRTKKDQDSLIEAIKNDVIEVIVTDHAPHSKDEKDTTFDKANMGIIGIEHSFSLIYTYLVKTKIITLKKCIELMSFNPCRIFNIEDNSIENDKLANLCIYDLNTNVIIKEEDIVSKGESSPFIGKEINAECLLTIVNGKINYRKGIK